jgi:hypothetical protein
MAQVLVEKQQVIDSALDKDHPERTAPVYVPREAAATHSDTIDTLAKIGEALSPEQIAAIHQGLRHLSNMDFDLASIWNGEGFSKIDVRIGHSLAEAARLSPKQAALGLKLCRKYRRQLGDDLLATINGGA